MDELLKCPFCGGEGVLQENVFHGYINIYVVCCDCGSATRQWYESRADAIAAWNRRHDPEADDLHVGDVVEDEYGRTAYVLLPRNKFGEHTLLLMKDYAFPQWAYIKDWRKITGHNLILESYVKEAYAALTGENEEDEG